MCVCVCVYVYVYVFGPMLCGVFRCAAAQFYIVARTGVFTTCTGLNTGLQRGHPPLLSLLDQSWTEILSANFIVAFRVWCVYRCAAAH